MTLFIDMDIRQISKTELENAIATSFSWSESMRKFGKTSRGASFQYFQNRVRTLGIDTSHFLGKSAHAGARQTGSCKKKTWQEILVKGKTLQRERCQVFRRVYKEYCEEKNVPIECVECKNKGEWLGRPLRLQINHKDEVRSNNTPSNLEWVCPNCHDVKTTY